MSASDLGMNVTNVTILGQAPGRRGDPSLPLEGYRARLLELLGADDAAWSAIRKLNALDRFPGKARKGDRFPLAEALVSVARIRPALRGDLVFVLGRHAARALRVSAPFLVRACDVVGGFEFVIVPHPSRVSLWWNLEENRARAKEVCSRAFREHLEAVPV